MNPLGKISVLDLSRALSGPYCTMMLGDYGADVIKIEIPDRGDDTRNWTPPSIGHESAYFLSVNRNKRSMTLNVKHSQGKEILLALAKTADVVVENFTPGVTTRLGIDYETMRSINPGLIYCSISGFGQTGPYSTKPAYDQIMQGLGGLMGVTGEPGGLPTKVGVAITDIGSGMFAAYGIVLALMARGTRKSSHGQHIDISMLDAQVAWLTYMAGYFFATGKDPEKIGAAHPNLVPYQAFLCGDGKFINVAVGSQRLWERFCEGIDRKDLFDHSDFRQNSDRVTNKSRLLPILETEFSKKTMAQWVSKLENHGVPCGPINLISDIFSDPQVIHRNMLLDISHSTIGSIKQTGIPIKFSKTPGSIYRPPPTLGQHTNEILAGLGYRADQIKLLKKQGVI